MKFWICNFQTDFSDWWLRHLLWNCPNMNVTGLHWWSVSIGSGNGLVPSGNKPLPEPMLTQICRHMASLGLNELISKYDLYKHIGNSSRQSFSWLMYITSQKLCTQFVICFLRLWLGTNWFYNPFFRITSWSQCQLTHCGPEIWVNIGSGNGLLPDGTKSLPEPMLTDHQWSPVTFILGQFHKRCLNHQSLKSVWKLHV